jgi:transcriptional regulator with XRE-family HTH domain
MLDLTQAELARGVGCAAITIRKIERDERRPSRQMAELLAEHLAIPSSQLDAFLRSGRGEMVVAGEGRRSRPGLPGFLNQPDGDDEQTQNAFVARETELARLAGWLQQAVDGSGRIGFVAGEAGRGKSSLLAEFARRSLEQHRKLVVASGICNAFSGTGDPYLPFRDILSMLAGDVESRWSGRSINREQAIRLWRLSPETNRMLLEEGQVLVDVLIPGAHISRVAEQHQDGPAGWREKLHRITE